jgi:hypothetical protein
MTLVTGAVWQRLSSLTKRRSRLTMGLITLVIVSEQDGAIHNANGKSFLDKARYQVVSVVDTGLIRGGYKTFTEADGSKVLRSTL